MMFQSLPDTARNFYDSMLVHAIASLKLNRYEDNFDAERFNFDGVDHAHDFNPGIYAFYFDWFVRNSDKLFAAYSALEDEASKRLYLYLILFRLAGHTSVKLPVAFAGRAGELAAYQSIEKSKPSQFASGGAFGQLRHYDFEYKNNHYVADCLGLVNYLFRGQYFFSRDGIYIAPERGDFVIDGGACTGDSSAVFSNAVGAEGRVFAFDPVADHLKILQYNAQQFSHANVQVMPFGLSDRNVDAAPVVLNQYAPAFNSASQAVPLRTIDALVKAGEIGKIDFIKLDVEGAELETLRGAQASIDRFKPKLAISLYHKPDDLFELILHIKEQFPFYSCYIDHYTIHMEETVLYCIW